MSIFATRRGRGSRGVALRVSSNPTQELWARLKDRSVLLRLFVCLAAIGGLIVSVQAWKQPIPFRLEQKPPHGVAAQIDFKLIDRPRTTRARERAAEQQPFIFTHDPQPLQRLPDELKTSLVQLAQAPVLAQATIESRTEFGLLPQTQRSPATGAAPSPDDLFAKLKEVAADDMRLREAIASFTKFIEPLKKTGLVRPEHFPAEMNLADPVAIVSAGQTRELVAIDEIQLPQLLAPTGALFARWGEFPVLQPIRPALEHWLSIQAPETLHYDDVQTQAARQEARAAAAEVYKVYNRENLLVRPGESIDEPKLAELQAEYDQIERQVPAAQRVLRLATVFLLFLVLTALNAHYLIHNEPRLIASPLRLSVYLGLLVLTVLLGRAFSFDPWRAEVGPLLAAVMVLAIAYDQVLATVTAFSLCLVLTLSTGADFSEFVIMMSVCATAVILLPSVSSRSTLVVVGIGSAATYFLMFWGTAMIGWGAEVVTDDQPNLTLLTDLIHSLRGSAWCLVAGFLVSGCLPFIETTFGVVTDISLLELGDVSHPILQELVRRAPGTYNHSITVATIGETAADAIGANGLLVRVGAYFHDIGKMLKPHYFVENTIAGGENRHENLAPAMSTLIIIGHVKDGVDLAEQHNLPRPLVDFIEQHHGTTLVEYFYHEATRQADLQPDHRTDAEEASFRYPGPKPQTREAGVLMLADAVEGASRTLSEPTPKRIERLVHDIAIKRLLDGQFDDSGLTITELSIIQDSLTKSLIAMYHARIKYPEQRTA